MYGNEPPQKAGSALSPMMTAIVIILIILFILFIMFILFVGEATGQIVQVHQVAGGIAKSVKKLLK
jgi:sorbitol-specific phosphotransferase system component IIC